jgi:hypothetical protein
MTERNNLVMGFISNTNERISMTLPRIRATLNGAEAATLMAGIIASNIVLTGRGRPTVADSAVLVNTQITRVV